jgi:hypothetical protein
MNEAKITLSEDELNLVSNQQFILTKNQIIDKVYTLFGSMADCLKNEFEPLEKQLADVLEIPPKISRGENYLELPYVILDYPRYFRPHDIFAIRTMFWWGNFFSVTLHLKGNYREHYHARIIAAYPRLCEDGFFAGIGVDEWEHHFGEDNFLPVSMIESDEWLTLYDARDFTKLALKYPLEQWNQLEQLLPDAYHKILRMLGH